MGTDRQQRREMVATARKVADAMRDIDAGIQALAVHSGKLLALMDNADQVETLSSIRSDTAYQLVGNLSQAYNDLAGFLKSEAWD